MKANDIFIDYTKTEIGSCARLKQFFFNPKY